MSIHTSPFGAVDGREATLYTLTNQSGAQLKLTDYGARVVSVIVPDKHGHMADVALGFDDAAAYKSNTSAYCGATVGRFGNRIGGSSFSLNGKVYTLFANEGKNTLHGGKTGFDRRWWTVSCEEGEQADIVTMTYDSADGEEGYPGRLLVEVSFAWTKQNDLVLCYQAKAEADTILNLTNHAYFNLKGEGDILDHMLRINASCITETDDQLIPTGRDLPVDGLPVDLRKGVILREGIARAGEYPLMQKVNGYDMNFRVDGEGFRAVAALREPHSGREMHVFSTEPCVQLYTGQGFNAVGRNGTQYAAYAGLALETQHHPDAIHHPNYPGVVLRGGETFTSRTVYCFTTGA